MPTKQQRKRSEAALKGVATRRANKAKQDRLNKYIQAGYGVKVKETEKGVVLPNEVTDKSQIVVGLNMSNGNTEDYEKLADFGRNLAANPKDAAGRAKVPLSLVPLILKAEVSLAFLEGKLKYGEVNWRETPVFASVYIDAGMRHWEAYAEGEDRDQESCVHHLGNTGACAGILLDAANYGTLIDDRKMSNGNALSFMDALKQTVKHLNDLHAGKAVRHYKIGEHDQIVFTTKSNGRSQQLKK